MWNLLGNSDNTDFKSLVKQLDDFLKITDGDDHAFYNQYNSKKPENKINPETNKPWEAPEISENLALDELSKGDALDAKRIDALVAFMKLLTDKRYESLN